MRNTAGDDGPHAAADSARGDGGLPGWASRHLAEAALHPGTVGPDAVVTSPPASGRHRYARRREPSRLRGWALATAAIAAATGTVPLALATLAREEPPMPRIGTFPVAAPADLGLGAAPVAGGSGSSPAGTPGPDLASTLPPLAAPVVVPTAQNRPLPPATRRAPVRGFVDDERPERPPRSAPTTTTTTTRTTATSTSDPDEEPRETPTPRESTTTTTTTTDRGGSAERSTDDGDDRGGADRDTSLLGSAVGTVRGVGGGLLG